MRPADLAQQRTIATTASPQVKFIQQGFQVDAATTAYLPAGPYAGDVYYTEFVETMPSAPAPAFASEPPTPQGPCMTTLQPSRSLPFLSFRLTPSLGDPNPSRNRRDRG